MKKIKQFFTAFFVSLMTLLGLGLFVPAKAQIECGTPGSLLPEQICDLFNTAANDPAGFVTNRVRFGLIVALGVVILVAVIFSIIAAIKYISSQGNESKVEEAKKSVANILIGIAVLFIAFVGIILIFTIFNVRPTTPSICNACLVAPESRVCERYTTSGRWEAGCDCGKSPGDNTPLTAEQCLGQP